MTKTTTSKKNNKGNNSNAKAKKADIISDDKSIKVKQPIRAKNKTVEKDVSKKNSLKIKIHEYLTFVDWCATPTPLRNPKTQILLAKELKVDNATLSDWKNKENFFRDVQNSIKKNFSIDKTSDVVYSLYRNIVKKGNGVDAKIWLEYITGFSSKQTVEDVTERAPAVDTTQILEHTKALINAGFEGLTKNNEKLKEQFLADKSKGVDLDDGEVDEFEDETIKL